MTTAAPNVQELQRQLAEQTDRFSRYRQGVRAILHAPKEDKATKQGWAQSDKTYLIETFDRAFDNEGRFEASRRQIADAIGLTKPTARKAYRRLSTAGYIGTVRPSKAYECDKNGTKIRSDAPLTKPIDWDSRHWESTPGLYEVSIDLAGPLKPLPRVPYQEKQRERAQAREQARKIACPHCGTIGEWRMKCEACSYELNTREEVLPETDTMQVEPQTNPREEVLPILIASIGEEVLPAARDALTPPQLCAPVIDFLQERIGEDRTIIKQKQPTDPGKYITLPSSEAPDYGAYLAGRIVYGSRPRLANGLTQQIEYDFDGDGDPYAPDAAQELRQAGAYPILWDRNGLDRQGYYRLTIRFDPPVDAEAAKVWTLDHSAALRTWAAAAGEPPTRECFPCKGGACWKDRANHGLGWPLTRLTHRGIISCAVSFYTPTGLLWSPGWMESPDGIRQGLAECITPAALIPTRPQPSTPTTSRRPAAEPTANSSRGGVSASPGLQYPGMTLVEAAIAHYNDTHSAEDVLPANVRRQGNRIAIRQNDHTPSVHKDYDNYSREMYTDFGTNEKLDPFEIYVRANHLDKHRAIWDEIVPAYLEYQGLPPLK